MDIAYMDESGDDGIAEGSSPFFVLCKVRIPAANWTVAADGLESLRRGLDDELGFTAEIELHARPLLLRKHPYREMGIHPGLVERLCDGVSALLLSAEASVAIWCVEKNKGGPLPLEAVLVPAMASSNGSPRVIFSDTGRVGVMRRIHALALARGDIDRGVIESIQGLSSVSSPFVQVADLYATAAYLSIAREGGLLHARMKIGEVMSLLHLLSGPNLMMNQVQT